MTTFVGTEMAVTMDANIQNNGSWVYRRGKSAFFHMDAQPKVGWSTEWALGILPAGYWPRRDFHFLLYGDLLLKFRAADGAMVFFGHGHPPRATTCWAPLPTHSPDRTTAMTYLVQNSIATSLGMTVRVAQAAAQEDAPGSPDEWAQDNRRDWAAAPGWEDAWASAMVGHEDDQPP